MMCITTSRIGRSLRLLPPGAAAQVAPCDDWTLALADLSTVKARPGRYRYEAEDEDRDETDKRELRLALGNSTRH